MNQRFPSVGNLIVFIIQYQINYTVPLSLCTILIDIHLRNPFKKFYFQVSSGEYSISDSFTDGDSSSEMSESQPGGLNRRLQRKSHHYDNGPIKYREGEVMGFVSTNV
ncbi:unnamed protein product [Heterobilharzia americana]|nr:unnamed protein product [Heterobilharzia americana]